LLIEDTPRNITSILQEWRVTLQLRKLQTCKLPETVIIPTTIDKDMIKSCEIISQVDNKVIIIKMNNSLFAVDQHAADERCKLEALQKDNTGLNSVKANIYYSTSSTTVNKIIQFHEPICKWGWEFKYLLKILFIFYYK